MTDQLEAFYEEGIAIPPSEFVGSKNPFTVSLELTHSLFLRVIKAIVARLYAASCGCTLCGDLQCGGHFREKLPSDADSAVLLNCTICRRTIASARYASHLEKCFGMGRIASSKRRASLSEEQRQKKPFIKTEGEQSATTVRPVEDDDIFDSFFSGVL